jgi:hypothetical protein
MSAARLTVAGLLALAGVACTKYNPHYLGPDARMEVGTDGSGSEPSPEAGADARDAADAPAAVDAHDAGMEPMPDVPKRCSGPADCTSDPGGRACDTGSGKCVTCVGDGDCRTDGGTLVCDTGAHACVQCLLSTQCGGATPVCDTGAKTCVQCLMTSQCSGTTPICNTTAKLCHACKTDGDCVTAAGADPGLCAPDGHCVGTGEVIYAITPSSCGVLDATYGTLAKPYCTARDAVAAAAGPTAPKPFVVLRGNFGGFSVGATTGRVTVVGQGTVVLNPGSDPYAVESLGTSDVLVRHVSLMSGTSGGAHVSGASAKLALVDVQVTASALSGVVADTGAALTLDRCVIKGNGGLALPALTTTNASFHITNTVLASSSIGASLGVVPAGGEQLFKNNTIVGNGTAMRCFDVHSTTGLILQGNANAPDTTCVGAATCCTGDPLLTADYHLMPGSPCVDQLAFDPDVPDDLDGQARPLGTSMKSDCGADELGP